MLKEILENAFIKILGLHPSATRGEINNVYAQAEAEILEHYVAKEEVREWVERNCDRLYRTDGTEKIKLQDVDDLCKFLGFEEVEE